MLLALVCLLAGCSSQNAQTARQTAGPPNIPPAPVSVAVATQESVPIQLSAVGTVEPSDTVQVKSQIAGELMTVRPAVIDLGWGELKSAIAALKDTGFVAPQEAAVQRLRLLDQYVAAFRHVEAGARDKGAAGLKDLSTSVASRVTAADREAIAKLVDAQLAKLT